MQQINYPTLNTTDQQTPSQQLFDNRNQNLKFIPVIIPSEGQNQYQQQYTTQQQYSHNQVTPNLEFSNIQVNQQLIQSTPNLIKDQDFSQQKQLLFSIMGIFTLWTILSVFLFYIMIPSVFINISASEFYLILAICSLVAIGALLKFGIDQKYRKTLSSLLILFGLVFCYTLFYTGLLFFVSISVHDYWTSLVIYLAFQCVICINFIMNFIILIYLLLEKTKINMIYVCFIEFAIIALLGILYQPFFYILILAIPYPICILNSFRQILNGRFNLKSDEVIAASIATFYGMIICCED